MHSMSATLPIDLLLMTVSVEDSDEGEEMDMDLESEEDDSPARPTASSSKPRSGLPGAGRNPYPLEGKYIDEDDREQ